MGGVHVWSRDSRSGATAYIPAGDAGDLPDMVADRMKDELHQQ